MSSRLHTARQALERLREGNERFVRRQPNHGNLSATAFARRIDGQHPFAVILGCSDSRVPPELVFDQSFGDLFVIRLAGNIIAPGVGGSIQYAHQHLGTSLLVVLRHEGCGAVKAALAAKFQHATDPERIRQLVDLIEPCLAGIAPGQPHAEQMRAGVEANVRWSMRQVSATPEARQALEGGRDVLIVAAVYGFATGKVRWLDPPT